MPTGAVHTTAKLKTLRCSRDSQPTAPCCQLTYNHTDRSNRQQLSRSLLWQTWFGVCIDTIYTDMMGTQEQKCVAAFVHTGLV